MIGLIYRFVLSVSSKLTFKGMDRGITQRAAKSVVFTEDRLMVWNFPLDLTLKSTNPFGWPQIAVSVYGPDWAGREIIRGYGTARLPLATGR